MRTQEGFTLLETLIYLSLLGIIFGGAITATFGMVESSNRTQAHITLLEEGNFILAKLNWALLDAESINISGNHLSVNKFSYANNPVIFDDTLRLSQDNGQPQNLNADNVQVQNVAFQDIPATATTTQGLVVSFTLSLVSPDRPGSSQNFVLSHYLKK